MRARGRVRRRAGDARVVRRHDGAGQTADGDADARGAPEARALNVDDGPEAARRVLYDGRNRGRRRRRALVRHAARKRFGRHAHVVHLQEVAVVERRRLHRQDVPRVEEPAVVAVEPPLDGPRHGLGGAVARAVRREADRRVFYLTTGHVQCLGHTVRRAGVGVEVVPDDAVLAPGEGPARAVRRRRGRRVFGYSLGGAGDAPVDVRVAAVVQTVSCGTLAVALAERADCHVVAVCQIRVRGALAFVDYFDIARAQVEHQGRLGRGKADVPVFRSGRPAVEGIRPVASIIIDALVADVRVVHLDVPLGIQVDLAARADVDRQRARVRRRRRADK